MAEVLFNHPPFRVTSQILKTGRRTYKLGHIEQLHIRRPVIPAIVLLGIATAGFARVFHSLLYTYEVWILLAAPWALLPIATQIGVLTIIYRGIGGTGMVFGRIAVLRRVRTEIDGVLDEEEARR